MAQYLTKDQRGSLRKLWNANQLVFMEETRDELLAAVPELLDLADGMDLDIDFHAGRCTNLEQQLAETTARVEKAEGRVTELESRLAGAPRDLSSYAFNNYGNDAWLYNGIHDLESKLAELTARVAAIADDHWPDNDSQAPQALEQMQKALDAANARAEKAEAGLAALRETASQVLADGFESCYDGNPVVCVDVELVSALEKCRQDTAAAAEAHERRIRRDERRKALEGLRDDFERWTKECNVPEYVDGIDCAFRSIQQRLAVIYATDAPPAAKEAADA